MVAYREIQLRIGRIDFFFKYLSAWKIHLLLMIKNITQAGEILLPLMIVFQKIIKYLGIRQGNTSAARSSGNNYFVIFSCGIFIAYHIKVIICYVSNYLLAPASYLVQKIQALIRQRNIQKEKRISRQYRITNWPLPYWNICYCSLEMCVRYSKSFLTPR